MKKLLLGLAFLFGFVASASAQCVGITGVNSVPQVGFVCQTDPTVPSYAATGIGIVPASSATDVSCITGSATKVVRVKQVRVGGSAGTAVTVPVTLRFHITPNTGGTPTTSTALPVPYALDSGNAAATATTTAYTANPTIADASPGLVDALGVALVLTSGSGALSTSTFNVDATQSIVLRGINQQLCVNFNAVTVSSGLVTVSYRWTEAAQ